MSHDHQDALQLLLLKFEASLIGSTCVYQGEELGLDDARNIPIDQMQDPWGIEFAPTFLGRDTCRTPMVWDETQPHGGFSDAETTWLPVEAKHLQRTALREQARPDSIYRQFSKFLEWRKAQPAFMKANTMEILKTDDQTISFDRISDAQTLRCNFDFESLSASFEEIQ